jgi:hypothetical protein
LTRPHLLNPTSASNRVGFYTLEVFKSQQKVEAKSFRFFGGTSRGDPCPHAGARLKQASKTGGVRLSAHAGAGCGPVLGRAQIETEPHCGQSLLGRQPAARWRRGNKIMVRASKQSSDSKSHLAQSYVAACTAVPPRTVSFSFRVLLLF